ncbi:hypothetical protein J7F03_20685 [Streptomyces sp. ISL-43]|uniref:hypothetical protein n=1 Tax=Streptomyces sp. ISL-43 TaxID=2819183 RepID=UPI001BE821D8|nr:hypothetical protein [Streptomyces sp. ISL-43]MBT2449460.1 hypothetical protein [Streptomyces sp. ISL-43]
MTTATALRTIATDWPRLTTALEDGTNGTWPPAGRMTDYLRALDVEQAEYDRWRAGHRAALDRNPAQLGATRPPLSIHVHDAMRTIEIALAGCADVIAAQSQIEPTPFATADWPAADRTRRNARARADLADPKRWRFRGNVPRAPYTALWLLARVEARPGPFRPLTDAGRRHIAGIAREAVTRMDRVLGLVVADVEDARPCPDCGGLITVRSGAGAPPMARCSGCERLWTMADTMAA